MTTPTRGPESEESRNPSTIIGLVGLELDNWSRIVSVSRMSLVLTLAVGAISFPFAAAQQSSRSSTSGSSGSSFGNSLGSSSGLQSGSNARKSFRPSSSNSRNNSDRQTSMTPGTDPFMQARGDARQIGEASRGQNQGRSNQAGSNRQGILGGRGAGAGNALRNQQRGGMNSQFTGQGRTQRLRPVVQIAFPTISSPHNDFSPTPTIALTRAMQGLDNVNISLADGVAIIEGTARTAHEAQLAAALLSLEPGVRSVRNNLTVEPAP